MKRIGVVGVIVTGDKNTVMQMQSVLSDFGDIIVGRMGVPREHVNTIALIVEGEQERLSALTGRLGKLDGINVKSALTSVEIED